MRFKIHKNRQKIILRYTIIAGLFSWTLIGFGFFRLEQKQLAREQKNAIEENVAGQNSQENNLETGTNINVPAETVENIIEQQPPVEKTATEIVKPVVVARPVSSKAPVRPASGFGRLAIAPGVLFTNDHKKASCKASGVDHDKSEHGKKNHYDEDCCIDRDEWLLPGCVYTYDDAKYSLNGKKPLPNKRVPIRK